MQKRTRLRLRKRDTSYTIEDLAERWGRPVGTIRNWIYRAKVLRPLPSSTGRGRGLRFSRATVERFEADYEGLVPFEIDVADTDKQ